MNRHLLTSTPNLSLVLPGRCNAGCSFCFWNSRARGNAGIVPGYIERLRDALDSLPVAFKQISITGGEPLLSPVFLRVCAELRARKEQFPKVVLTTNGSLLGGDVIRNAIAYSVDHINISRHHYEDRENWRTFGTSVVPSAEALIRHIANFHLRTSVDVSLNCVVGPETTEGFCERYIRFARGTSAVAVNFRERHDLMEPSPTQVAMCKKYGVEWEASCPVCRTVSMSVRGMPVNWKYSVAEPIKHWDGIFELIFQPDCTLTADWAGTQIIKPEDIVEPQTTHQLALEMLETAKQLLSKPDAPVGQEPTKKTAEKVRTVYVERQGYGVPGYGCGGYGHGGC